MYSANVYLLKLLKQQGMPQQKFLVIAHSIIVSRILCEEDRNHRAKIYRAGHYIFALWFLSSSSSFFLFFFA